MANPSYTDILTAALENRLSAISDNTTIHVPVLDRMKKRDNVIPFSGGSKILEPLMYGENGTVMWFSGYETLNIAPQQVITEAEYGIRFLAGTVSVSGEEELLVSGDRHTVIPFLSSKIDHLKSSMMNTLAIGVFSDGTGAGGKQIQGTRAFLSTSPGSAGIVGGINRNTWSFWRNKVLDLGGTPPVADNTNAASIHAAMSKLCRDLVRNEDYPDLWVADDIGFGIYEQSLLPYQRTTAKDEYGSGFMALKFYGQGRVADVIFAGNSVSFPTKTMYALNTKYLRLRPHSKRDMKSLGPRKPVNQDATVEIVGWAGNMTCNNLAQQGILRWN